MTGKQTVWQTNDEWNPRDQLSWEEWLQMDTADLISELGTGEKWRERLSEVMRRNMTQEDVEN